MLKISKAHEDVSGANTWQAELARAPFTEPLIAGGDRVVEGGGFLRKPLSRGERMERHKNQCQKNQDGVEKVVRFSILLLSPTPLSLCLF